MHFVVTTSSVSYVVRLSTPPETVFLVPRTASKSKALTVYQTVHTKTKNPLQNYRESLSLGSFEILT